MTKGELSNIAYALFKISIIEENINKVEVMDAIGNGGIEIVQDAQDALNALAQMIVDHTDRSKRS